MILLSLPKLTLFEINGDDSGNTRVGCSECILDSLETDNLVGKVVDASLFLYCGILNALVDPQICEVFVLIEFLIWSNSDAIFDMESTSFVSFLGLLASY